MLETNTSNQNPNDRQQTTAYESTQTYKVIHQVGDKVVQGLNQAGVASDKFARGIDEAAKEINRAVDTLNRNLNSRAAQGRTYRPPTQYSQRYQQNQNYNNNTYTQPNGAPNRQPNSVPPQQATRSGYTYTPPQPQHRNTQPRTPYHRPVQPVPPPVKPGMIEKRRPSNAKFWFAGILCTLYALTMPMYDWIHLAPLAVVGVGAFFLGRLIFKGKKYYVPAEEEKKPEPVKKPEPEPVKKSATGNPEVDKIIDEGQEYLKQLRAANDRIPDEVMSARISRMEIASADIFSYIAEHPEKAAQIRRFMNYYLPTTLKLLKSYDKLSRQRVKGENIQNTMFEIEGMMETIAGAFEKQLDSLFGEDAMDIAADISVMESILKQEGLSDDEDAVFPKPQTKAAGNKVEQTQAASGIPTLTLDPDAVEEKNSNAAN